MHLLDLYPKGGIYLKGFVNAKRVRTAMKFHMAFSFRGDQHASQFPTLQQHHIIYSIKRAKALVAKNAYPVVCKLAPERPSQTVVAIRRKTVNSKRPDSQPKEMAEKVIRPLLTLGTAPRANSKFPCDEIASSFFRVPPPCKKVSFVVLALVYRQNTQNLGSISSLPALV